MKVTEIDKLWEAVRKGLYTLAMHTRPAGKMHDLLTSILMFGVNKTTIGRILGVSQSLVGHWVSKSKPIPHKYMVDLLDILTNTIALAYRVCDDAELTGMYPPVAIDTFKERIEQAEDVLHEYLALKPKKKVRARLVGIS